MKEEYAYGYWDVEGTACPLKSAGLDDELHASDLAESFDDELVYSNEVEDDQGTVDAETARNVFVRLKNRYMASTNRDPEMQEYNENMYRLCEEVLKKEFEDD